MQTQSEPSVSLDETPHVYLYETELGLSRRLAHY